MKRFVVCVVLLCVCGMAAAENPSLADMPAAQFLEAIRRPLCSDAWSVITGKLTCARKGQPLLEGTLRMSVRLGKDRMVTQITLNDVNTYILEQKHGGKTQPKIDIEYPDKEEKPGLFEFAVRPDDVSFAFFYWELDRELTSAADKKKATRVMRLKNPGKAGETVTVTFSSRHGFPIQASWADAAGKVQRVLELKGAKRHQDGVWFVRDMRLSAADGSWKTQVRFDYVEKNKIGD